MMEKIGNALIVIGAILFAIFILILAWDKGIKCFIFTSGVLCIAYGAGLVIFSDN